MSAGNVLPLAEEQRLAIVGFYGSLLALLITITCASLAGLVLARGGLGVKKSLPVSLWVPIGQG